MNNFEWIQPETVADAIAALDHAGAMPLAGGVDLLDRLKERLEAVVARTILAALVTTNGRQP